MPEETLENKDMIVVGLQSLDSRIGSNCVNIAYEFARNNRVLYINYAPDRITLLRHKRDPLVAKRINILKGKEADLVQIDKDFYNLYPRTTLESINQIGPRFIFDSLNKINSKRFVKKIKAAIDHLGFNDYIIFNDSDFYRSFFLKEELKPAAYIYYTRDNMVATSYYRKHGQRYESRLMSKVDAVVANSVYLQRKALKYNKNSHYVGQGVDLALFAKDKIKTPPDDISDLKKPIIGYIGALKSSRLDIDLIHSIAKARPEYSIVLVGPEDEIFAASKLHQQSNVYFLGSKPLDELPTYLDVFDIAMNPQAVNMLTIGNYPRKIDEYLALGKPTLATKTEAMQVFANHVYLAETADDYIQMIERGLTENSKKKIEGRKKFAHSHTWENSVKEIYKVMNDVIQS